MKRLPLIIYLLILGLTSPKLLADNTDTVLDAWFAAQKNLSSWSADFIQTRTLPTLTHPLVSKGHVDFAVPDEFRWALGQPARTIALGKGRDMYVIYPFLKRAEHYPMGPNTPKQWRDMMSLLQAGFPRTRPEFEAQFQVLSVTATNGNWLLALAPRSAFARQMMPHLNLGIATNNFSLTSTEMIFADDSHMRSDFTNAVVNPTLDPSLFDWQPPADFNVTEPMSK